MRLACYNAKTRPSRKRKREAGVKLSRLSQELREHDEGSTRTELAEPALPVTEWQRLSSEADDGGATGLGHRMAAARLWLGARVGGNLACLAPAANAEVNAIGWAAASHDPGAADFQVFILNGVLLLFHLVWVHCCVLCGTSSHFAGLKADWVEGRLGCVYKGDVIGFQGAWRGYLKEKAEVEWDDVAVKRASFVCCESGTLRD
ncbi:hypothetical protein V8C26DRAFT_241191 [Trichoderma gracile]